jgi:nitrogen-specific signal transduction histidine kinase/ActR/RegA family two-component response regulator
VASQDQVLGVATDITERKKLEEQFRQSQKLEAIGALAGGVAHDFNNLLTVITGYTDLSLTRHQPDDQLRRNLEEVGKAAARAAQLTRQLLAFSRRQVLQPRVLDLNAVVVNMERMLGRLIGADIRLSTILDPGSGQVKADPGQLEQVIMNLAVNARDAMPEGGNLTIGTRNLVVSETIASQAFSLPPGSYVLLEISDTGSGMDEKTQSRVYEPFFTTKPVGKGTGLGLSTVYGIVKQSGGYIEIESEIGRGTLFRVYLPLAPSGEVPEPEAVPAAVCRGCETILLVEDEEAVRAVTREILEGNGYVVLEAASGEEALHISEAYQGPIHLVLSDLVMPGMGGRAAVHELLLQRSDLRAVYASGYVQEAVFKQQVLEPGTLFLQKPYSPSELIVAVCDALKSNLGETRK